MSRALVWAHVLRARSFRVDRSPALPEAVVPNPAASGQTVEIGVLGTPNSRAWGQEVEIGALGAPNSRACGQEVEIGMLGAPNSGSCGQEVEIAADAKLSLRKARQATDVREQRVRRTTR